MRTPATSVIAFATPGGNMPGVTPSARARARPLATGDVSCAAVPAGATAITNRPAINLTICPPHGWRKGENIDKLPRRAYERGVLALRVHLSRRRFPCPVWLAGA